MPPREGQGSPLAPISAAVLAACVAWAAADGSRRSIRTTPLEAWEVDAVLDRTSREDDERGRALIDSFRERVFSLARDRSVRRAETDVSVVRDGSTERFRVTFDASQPFATQIAVEPADSLRPGTEPGRAFARGAAVVAFHGSSHVVLRPLTRARLEVTGPADAATVVVGPTENDPRSVYRFLPSGVIQYRGETYGEKVTRTKFDWGVTGTQFLLKRVHDVREAKGATGLAASPLAEYVYDESRGYPLLVSARANLDEGPVEVTFVWNRVE